jgi:hypothetical protein
MSGGHFNYNCFSISNFAEELDMEISKNNDTTLNSYGDTRGRCYSDDVVRRLRLAQKLIKLAGDMAYEAEWLYSDDTGEESFMSRFDELFNKHGCKFIESGNKIIIGISDEAKEDT